MLDFLEKSNSIVFWKTEKQLIFGHFLPKYDQKWIFYRAELPNKVFRL